MRRWRVVAAAVVLLTLGASEEEDETRETAADARSLMMPFHSFVPPFVAMAPNTMRRAVSDEVTAFGVTEVFQSFARLTPEKPRSVGALWSNFPLGEGVLDGARVSVVLAFRVSGRAAAEERGEGLALWLSAAPFKRGPSFGASEKFSGVGVLFDTRLNKVRAVASDRLPEDADDYEETHVAADCDAAALRYDATRDDFGHKNSSRARVIATPGRVRVLVDERHRNRWRVCADLALPERLASRGAAWLAAARVGVSAATGVSADAHDVLALETFSDARAHDAHLNSGWRKFVPRGADAPVTEARLRAIEDMVNWMTFKLEHLHHVFEHSTAAFRNDVARGADEFAALVVDEEARLAALEAIVRDESLLRVEQRFEELRAAYADLVDERVNHEHTGLDANVGRAAARETRPVEAAWRRPFYVLLAVHAAFFAGVALLFHRLKAFI